MCCELQGGDAMKKRKRVFNMRKKIKTDNNTVPYENTNSDVMAIHANAIDFAKVAIKYMFFANAGAITSVIFKLNIINYIFPIILFGLGTIYTIFLSLYMYVCACTYMYI